MLKNYIDVNEAKNRNNRVPKNNYFCHRWRVKDAFSKSIDREMFHMNILGGDQHRTLMNNKILSLYKSRYNRNRADLIVDLAHKAMIFLEKRRYQQFSSSQVEVVLTNHTRGLVERCYNTLFAFTTELNSLLGLSELFITATEPSLTNRENGKATVDSKTLARVSTNLYSLFIEGTKDRIKFYILPAEDLLALVDVSLDYEATCRWDAHLLKNGSVQWRDKNGDLTDEILEITCVELLNQLLENTKERLMPSELVADKKGEFSYNAPDPWHKDNEQRTIESTTLILDAIRPSTETWKPVEQPEGRKQVDGFSALPPSTRQPNKGSFPNAPTSPATAIPSLNRTSERIAQSDVGTTTSWNHPVLDCSKLPNGELFDLLTKSVTIETAPTKGTPEKKEVTSSKQRTSKRKRRSK